MSLRSRFTLASLYARLASLYSAKLGFAKLGGSEGAEILEFAISLPLLLVVVVGVFDFGTAFTVKQKLGNTALQGARVASNQPTADLSLAGGCGAPASICSVRDVVDKQPGCQRPQRLRTGRRQRRARRCADLDFYHHRNVCGGTADAHDRAWIYLHRHVAQPALFRRTTRLRPQG